MKLHHTYIPAGGGPAATEPLTQPDDITSIGTNLFTAFQNGVGPQGQPSTDGNTASTVVEFTLGGQVIHQWDIIGKCDGLTADPARGVVIATVNEDLNSSLYTIAPESPAATAVQHYTYNVSPLPHNGGTDAISVDNGQILISASAPGTIGNPPPQPTYPAVYKVALTSGHVAVVTPLFYDEANATVANTGSGFGTTVQLMLTDPDSSSVVPPWAPRFAGAFMLDSQGDQQQIFVNKGEGQGNAPSLSVLNLSQSVDDTGWVGPGVSLLVVTDHTNDRVDVVTGDFPRNAIFVVTTPCGANSAPPTCPAPGFPPNYLGVLNLFTGHVSHARTTGLSLQPQSLLVLAQP
jgi:hypothetical protein